MRTAHQKQNHVWQGWCNNIQPVLVRGFLKSTRLVILTTKWFGFKTASGSVPLHLSSLIHSPVMTDWFDFNISKHCGQIWVKTAVWVIALKLGLHLNANACENDAKVWCGTFVHCLAFAEAANRPRPQAVRSLVRTNFQHFSDVSILKYEVFYWWIDCRKCS